MYTNFPRAESKEQLGIILTQLITPRELIIYTRSTKPVDWAAARKREGVKHAAVPEWALTIRTHHSFYCISPTRKHYCRYKSNGNIAQFWPKIGLAWYEIWNVMGVDGSPFDIVPHVRMWLTAPQPGFGLDTTERTTPSFTLSAAGFIWTLLLAIFTIFTIFSFDV